jgi:hypothetical protein
VDAVLIFVPLPGGGRTPFDSPLPAAKVRRNFDRITAGFFVIYCLTSRTALW